MQKHVWLKIEGVTRLRLILSMNGFPKLAQMSLLWTCGYPMSNKGNLEAKGEATLNG